MVLVERNLRRGAEDLLEVGGSVVHHDEKIVELLALLDARQDQVIDLRGECIALHAADAAKNVDLAEDLLRRVLVLEQVSE